MEFVRRVGYTPYGLYNEFVYNEGIKCRTNKVLHRKKNYMEFLCNY